MPRDARPLPPPGPARTVCLPLYGGSRWNIGDRSQISEARVIARIGWRMNGVSEQPCVECRDMDGGWITLDADHPFNDRLFEMLWPEMEVKVDG